MRIHSFTMVEWEYLCIWLVSPATPLLLLLRGLCPLFDTFSPTGVNPIDAAPLLFAQHNGYATLPFCLHAPFPLDDVWQPLQHSSSSLFNQSPFTAPSLFTGNHLLDLILWIPLATCWTSWPNPLSCGHPCAWSCVAICMYPLSGNHLPDVELGPPLLHMVISVCFSF